MLLECCLCILGIVICIPIIIPLLDFITRLFSTKTRVNLNELSPKQRSLLIHQILDWCKANIHLNKVRRSQPTLFISKRTKTHYLGGYEYFNKKITIYILKHISIEELCDTIIHEYVHHLQLRSSRDDIRYNKLTNMKSYWENDFEVEARYIASKYSWKCINDLKF